MPPFRHNQHSGDSRALTGLARALSKLGICSRSQARAWIRSGRVRVNGTLIRDPEWRVSLGRDRIEMDGQNAQAEPKVYLVLNKPRGLVTTAADEQGRATVFDCLRPEPGAAAALPRVFPVGRLDKASEGLLLFTNDTQWAARITDPASRLEKIYHVQVDCIADETLARRLERGVQADGELLSAKKAAVLRQGRKNSWLEITLDEGRNRHIRRQLETLQVQVLRLVRVSIGPLQLGTLPKGSYRHLDASEVQSLARPPGVASPR